MRQGKIDKERESVCERVKDRYVRVERERENGVWEWMERRRDKRRMLWRGRDTRIREYDVNVDVDGENIIWKVQEWKRNRDRHSDRYMDIGNGRSRDHKKGNTRTIGVEQKQAKSMNTKVDMSRNKFDYEIMFPTRQVGWGGQTKIWRPTPNILTRTSKPVPSLVKNNVGIFLYNQTVNFYYIIQNVDNCLLLWTCSLSQQCAQNFPNPLGYNKVIETHIKHTCYLKHSTDKSKGPLLFSDKK